MRRLRRAGTRRLLVAAGGLLAAFALAVTAWPASAEPAPARAAPTVAKAADSLDPTNEPLPLLELTTGAGTHFYTLDRQEADAAVAQDGFTLQPMRTGYLRPAAFNGSQPIYRLSLNNQPKYLLTASSAERDSLVATGNWTYDGVIGYAAATQQTGTTELYRYNNGSDWRVGFQSPGSGWTLDGPLGYVYKTWIRAGALYFGTWDADTNPAIIQGGYTTFHRTYPDWWAGVRDYYSGPNPTVPTYQSPWYPYDFSDLEPSIGYYDDSQVSTVQKQITQASGAGLNYFAFYWYWNKTTDSEQFADGLHSFLQANNRNEMDFSLQVCSSNDPAIAIPASQFDAATTTFVSYLSQPNYLRANDGRPIVWLCDTRGIGSGSAADVDTFVGMLRAKAKAAIGTDLYLVSNQDLPLTPAQQDADGSYCSAPYNAVLANSYQQYVDNWQGAYEKAGPANYIRCVMSRFDERPRYPMLISDQSQVYYEADWNFTLFGQAVQNAATSLATSTRTSAVDNFLLIYAWNEWEEGGHIEPNVRDGCEYLNILQRDLSLPGSGCVADPAD